MPSNISISPPTQVMPMGTMNAFSEQIIREAVVDDAYAYGESTRQPLTLNPRRQFAISRPVTPAAANTLEQFYRDTMRSGASFWFYNLRETIPTGSWDPTGANPVGRYTVAWDGPLVRTLNLAGRPILLEFSLREVEG